MQRFQVAYHRISHKLLALLFTFYVIDYTVINTVNAVQDRTDFPLVLIVIFTFQGVLCLLLKFLNFFPASQEHALPKSCASFSFFVRMKHTSVQEHCRMAGCNTLNCTIHSCVSSVIFTTILQKYAK